MSVWLKTEIKGSSSLFRITFNRTGRAKVIGITGPPGAGKSTLVDSICNQIVTTGKSVAILAVDPTSPFSGGAILGDRIRMTRSSASEKVFLRSMASRGSLGGLAPQTREVIYALDLWGFDYILVETVGVGQAEIDVVKHVDTVLVTLMPGMGDTVQSLKAGVLEIGDVFVVNKADYPGADRLIAELKTLMSLAEFQGDDWRPEILSTIATKDEGIVELLKSIDSHRENIKLRSSKGSNLGSKKRKLLKEILLSELHTLFQKGIDTLSEAELSEGLAKFSARKEHPRSIAEKLFRSYAKHYLVSSASDSVES